MAFGFPRFSRAAGTTGGGGSPAVLWLGIVLLFAAHLVNPHVRAGLDWRLAVDGFSGRGLGGSLLVIVACAAAGLALAGLTAAAGGPIRRWLSGTRDPGTWSFEALTAGLIAYSLGLFGLGLTGLLRGWIPALMAVGIAATGLTDSGRRERGLSPRWSGTGARRIAGILAFGLLLLPALPWILSAPLLPPVNVDVLEYHIGLPERWAETGRIASFPGNVLFSMPLGFERLAVPFLLAGVAGGIPAFYFVLLALAAIAFAKSLREAGSSLAVPGGWLVFGCGSLLNLAGDGHPDTGLVFAAAAGMLAIGRGSVTGLALVCALAAAAKYQGVALAFSFLVAAAVGWPGGGGRIAAAGALTLAACAPWAIRNWYETGNPVYPFASAWMDSLNWHDWNRRVLWGSMQHASVTLQWRSAAGALAAYAGAFWAGVKTVWFSPYAVLLYAAPLIAVSKRNGVFARQTACQALIFALIWLLPHPKFGRYLLPAAVTALGSLLAAGGGRRQPVVAALLAALMLAQGASFVGQFRRAAAPAEAVLFGAASPQDYERAVFGEYLSTVKDINAVARGRRGRVLIIGQGHGWGLEPGVVANNETGVPAHLLVLGEDIDPARMAVRLKQADIRWILFNPVRAYHRRSFAWGHRRSEAWFRAYARLWRKRIELWRAPEKFDWTGGWYVYEVSGRSSSPGRRPWLPGGEGLIQDEAALAAGNADEELLSRQRRIMGDFGISVFQRAMEAFFVRGAREEAVRLARESLDRGLATPGVLNTLGHFLREQGRINEAKRCFIRALEMDPLSTAARDNLAALKGG